MRTLSLLCLLICTALTCLAQEQTDGIIEGNYYEVIWKKLPGDKTNASMLLSPSGDRVVYYPRSFDDQLAVVDTRTLEIVAQQRISLERSDENRWMWSSDGDYLVLKESNQSGRVVWNVRDNTITRVARNFPDSQFPFTLVRTNSTDRGGENVVEHPNCQLKSYSQIRHARFARRAEFLDCKGEHRFIQFVHGGVSANETFVVAPDLSYLIKGRGIYQFKVRDTPLDIAFSASSLDGIPGTLSNQMDRVMADEEDWLFGIVYKASVSPFDDSTVGPDLDAYRGIVFFKERDGNAFSVENTLLLARKRVERGYMITQEPLQVGDVITRLYTFKGDVTFPQDFWLVIDTVVK